MQLIDTMQETNGLLTETREPKLTKAVIRAIISGDSDQKATAREGTSSSKFGSSHEQDS